MKKVLSIWIILLILAMILSGCMEKVKDLDKELGLVKDQGTVNVTTEDKGPSQGGFINLFMLEPDTLNPLATQNLTVCQLSAFIFDGLFSESEDGMIEDALVDSCSFSQSGLIADIKLKDNIFFHDGQALSSDDVAYTVQTIKNAGDRSIYRGNVANILSVKTLDSQSLRIIFEKPDTTLSKLTFPIVPKHVFSNWPNDGLDKNLKPIGTGPFKFESFTNSYVKLVRNDSWWKTKAVGGLNHPVWLDGINFRIFSDESEMLQAFQEQKIDIATLQEGKLGGYEKRSGIFFRRYESNILEFLAFSNTGRSGSPVSQEILRAAIIKYLSWYGTKNPLSRGEPAFKYLSGADPQNEAINRESILTDLSEAGFKYQENKNILSFYKNGSNFPVILSLKYNGLNEDRKIVSEWIKEALAEIGIKVVPEAASAAEQQAFSKNGKFDMMLLGYRIPLFFDESEIMESIKGSLNLKGQNDVILPICRKYGAVLYHNRIRGSKIPVWDNIYNGWSEWYIVQ